MKYGIIDLGSNTIKLEVFEVFDDKKFSSIFYDVTYAYVVSHIKDRLLLTEGVNVITDALLFYKQKAKELICDKLVCFCTASLRYIDNQSESILKIKEKTGIEIIPFSGDEEAYCNYLSLKNTVNETGFIGADIGGGSAQILVDGENDIPEFCESFAVGGLKIKRDFVEDIFPTDEEKSNIISFVQAECSALARYKDKQETLYFMGGSILTICKILSKVLRENEQKEILVSELKTLIKMFSDDHEKAREVICSVQKERLNTIVSAMIVIKTIADILGIKTVRYTKSSVREGFLISQLKKGEF